MKKKDPALDVLAENLSEENRNQIKGCATFGRFRWDLPDDALTCSARMREILELEDNCNIERWEHLLACITPEDVEPFNDAISRILTGHNIVNVNFRANTAAGIKPLTLHGDVYRDAHGIPVVLEGVIQMRSVSAATEQMQYVTTLLMDTVHSVNNKLTAILGSTAMLASLLNDAQAPQRSGQYLEEIEHEVFLSAELLRQLVQAAKRR